MPSLTDEVAETGYEGEDLLSTAYDPIRRPFPQPPATLGGNRIKTKNRFPIPG